MGEENRREFLRSCVGAATTVAWAGNATALPTAPGFLDIHKIDVHSHIFEDIPALAEMMRSNNLRIINVCNRGSEPELLENQNRIVQTLFGKYGSSVFPFASSFDLTRRDQTGYSAEVISWLEKNFSVGAVMVKIWKEVGMGLKTRDGEFIMPDDSFFDPIYEYISSRQKPLLAHLADPVAAWRPLDPDNVHHGYYSRNPGWHLYGKKEYPSHRKLMASRDRILEKHPRLVVIGAHMGSLSHDVDEVAWRLDRYPNFYVECSARTADLSRQLPIKVRAFFQKYSNRILYGLDRTRRTPPGRTSAAEQKRFVEDMERRYQLDFHYYAGNGNLEYRGKKVEALGLPRDILELFYHGNAQRLMPALAN